MSATISPDATPRAPLIGEAPPSPAGPAPDGAPVVLPPALDLSRALTTLRFSVRQVPLVFKARRELGETFALRFLKRHKDDDEQVIVVTHPDHVRSLFTNPELAISATSESPLRPIVGPNSVLTTVGPTHMRQRKLLLPPFHGEAVERYTQTIVDVAEREIDSWPVGTPFALAPRMQAITLDVIGAGIFGVEGTPVPGTPEDKLRRMIVRFTDFSTKPIAQLVELRNLGTEEPVGLTKRVVDYADRTLYALIAQRRAELEAAGPDSQRTDILSLLLATTDEDGQPMSDREVRDELVTLVLAGHETTANTLAWAFERLLRSPAAYDRLREVARTTNDDATDDEDGWIEATIHEAMRNRPVVPLIGRRVQAPWQLGEFRVPANSLVLVSIALLHHREDVYPDPFNFRPERFLGIRPGTYTWIPFGGGIRRCLGAALAMAEQRVVLRAIARRTDMEAPDPRPERVLHRNVTMIPAKGTQVVMTARL